MCVGNVAPPKPTMPDERKLATKVWQSVLRQSCGWRLIHSSLPSGVMVMHLSGKPDGCGIMASSIAATVPDVVAWMAADTVPSASASNWPFNTLSPRATFNLGILPTCCLSGSTNFSGRLKCPIGSCVDCALFSGGCTPPWNLKILEKFTNAFIYFNL